MIENDRGISLWQLLRKIHFSQKRLVARIGARRGEHTSVLNETERRVALLP